jgi:hypothetical protein
VGPANSRRVAAFVAPPALKAPERSGAFASGRHFGMRAERASEPNVGLQTMIGVPMSIHPREHVPITKSPIAHRRSDVAAPLASLAVAVMLGVGITAFSPRTHFPVVQLTTTGQSIR